MKRKLIALAILMLTLVPMGAVNAGATPATNRTLLAIEQASAGEPMTPVGSGFTYQGRLLDGGSPATGTYDLRFTLFDASVGGNQVGTVTLPNQTVTNGLFTVILDFGSAAFLGDARFLQIEMQHNGGGYVPLTPRQPLTPAPYAMSLIPGATISGTTNLAMVQSINNGGSSGSALSGSDPLGTGVLGSSVGGNGVKGTNNSGTNAAVGALNFGFGPGITSFSVNGDGVQATSTGAGAGVVASSTNGIGVDAQGATTGVYGVGTNVNAPGVWGVASSSAQSPGVYGTSATGYGVWGFSDGVAGVYGTSGTGYGVQGISTAGNGRGVYGVASSGAAAAGVYGTSATGYGVQGISSAVGGSGVYGIDNNTGASGVKGVGGLGSGVAGSSSSGYGGIFTSTTASGVFATGTNGVFANGTAPNGAGLWGNANNGSGAAGVYGTSTSGQGVWGVTTAANGAGVKAQGNGSGTAALWIDNGAIKVTNAGNEANSPVFQHVVHTGTGGNTCSSNYYSVINNPYTNGNPNAILLVTQSMLWTSGSGTHTAYVFYSDIAFGDCPPNEWLIGRSDENTFDNLDKYNVLAIKP